MDGLQETKRVEALFERISSLIEQGRQRVVTAVNIAEVYTKYAIGQYIVEDEQKGESRAEYGKQVRCQYLRLAILALSAEQGSVSAKAKGMFLRVHRD